MPHTFLSYSRKNTEEMAFLRDDLTNRQIRVWTDEKIPIGASSWMREIQKAISEAYCLVVLMSPASKDSDTVEKEIEYASTHGKFIIPVLIEGDKESSVPFQLITANYHDLRGIKTLRDPRFINKKGRMNTENRLAILAYAIRSIEKYTLSEDENEIEEDLIDNEQEHLDIYEWSDFKQPGVHNYHGIAMLALASAELGFFEIAIKQMRRAIKLEPRIKNKVWMLEHHNWGEKENELLESILKHPDFPF